MFENVDFQKKKFIIFAQYIEKISRRILSLPVTLFFSFLSSLTIREFYFQREKLNYTYIYIYIIWGRIYRKKKKKKRIPYVKRPIIFVRFEVSTGEQELLKRNGH